MSFGLWAAELQSLDVPSDADGLTEAVACHDRYTAKLAMAVAAFDASGEWEIDGSTSVIAWLRDRGMTRAGAAELALLGRKLERLPVVADAWVLGSLSGGQVRVIAAQVIDRHVELFDSHCPELIPTFADLSVDDTAMLMRNWRAKADALNDGPEPRDQTCEARLSPTLDDRGLLTASLDAEGYALADAALRVADSNDLDVTAANRRGQALKDVFRYFLDHQQNKAGGRHRPHLNIVIKGETVGTDHVEGHDATSGVRLDSRTLERLMCDCAMHRVVMDASGTILDYGRATRTPPVNLFNALVIRDRHCRFPGCDRPANWCEAHHVTHWQHGGTTSVRTMVLQCSKHHHQIHKRGWKTELRLTGEFIVTTPWGLTRSTRPPGSLQQPELNWLDEPPGLPDLDPDLTELARERVRALIRV